MASRRPLRVVLCWAEIAGYSAACLRALSRRPGLDVHVVHPERLRNRPNPFNVTPLLEGVSNEMFDAARPDIDRHLLELVAARDPDVVVLCGWIYWPYTRLVKARALERARKLIGMDTPWRGTAIQRFAWWRLGHFMRAADLVVTAGPASVEYARRIGVPPARIRSGFYGFDSDSFTPLPRPAASPRQFLFAARYEPVKGVDTLVRGYRLYRESVSEPWGLTCHGAGPDARLLQNVEGIVDAGFVQPSELPAVLQRHGVFVLTSRFEPWGVVITEAAGAGLPIVATDVCGAAADIVRPYYNGIVIAPDDPEGLARAMRWMHEHADELPAMGCRGRSMAGAYGAEAWAARWHNYCLEVTDRSGVPA